MASSPRPSEYRVEKSRSYATVTLSNSDVLLGAFFVASSGPHLPGPERVGGLLNDESGFLPFEREADSGSRTVLLNRAHIVTVTLAEDEARHDTGYELARHRRVALRLSNGQRVVGTVRVYRPEGSDRLSDWARQPGVFRYIEVDQLTVIVNTTHVIDAIEVPE